MGFKTPYIINEDLLRENKILKEQIIQLKLLDSSKIDPVLELNNMNVVYRGIFNPMTILIPNAIKVEASAPGLKKINDFGNYQISPGSGLNVDILIIGIMPNGDTITNTKTLRIKDINVPIGTINRYGHGLPYEFEFSKESLMNSKIGIKIEDFLFDMDFKVESFKIQKNNKNAIYVDGSVFNEEANSLIKSAKRNDIIKIFEIRLENKSNVKLPTIAPINIRVIDL